MKDLRLEAQEILKLKRYKKEIEAEKREFSLEEMINYQKSISKTEFTERIQEQIDGYHSNLLESVNNAKTLKIDILKLEKNLFTGKDNNSTKSLIKYLPVEQKVAIFLDETNFEFVTDDIIVNQTLQALYNVIVESGIYPMWKIRDSDNKNSNILYLEINPLIEFEEMTVSLKRKREERNKIEKHAIVLYSKNLEGIKKERKRERIKRFLLLFFSTLYISVALLTVLSGVVDIFPVEQITDTFSMVALAWPYYLFSELKGVFILALPLGIVFSLYFAYKKS